MSKREISDSLKEIQFLASIRHKNIVGFYEVSRINVYNYSITVVSIQSIRSTVITK